MSDNAIEEAVRNARHLFLDFDGPVCAIFSGTPDHLIANQLRAKLTAAAIVVPAEVGDSGDPLEVFRAVAELSRQAAETAQRVLTTLEIKAAHTARPTYGAANLIATARVSGRTVSIVSNNSGAAIIAYLAHHGLTRSVATVVGRDDADPARMKPNPCRVRETVDKLGVQPSECVLVGDSPSDVTAGHAAGVSVIGFANKPGKDCRLARAGAEAVTMRLAEISAALRATES